MRAGRLRSPCAVVVVHAALACNAPAALPHGVHVLLACLGLCVGGRAQRKSALLGDGTHVLTNELRSQRQPLAPTSTHPSCPRHARLR